MPNHFYSRMEGKYEPFIERHLPICYGRSEYQFPISIFCKSLQLQNTTPCKTKTNSCNIEYLSIMSRNIKSLSKLMSELNG